ncbi:MAG: hypothetical protein AB1599_04025, partial [Planctomycetota bacterium]
NWCFDQNGQKPADLPQHLHPKRDRLLMLVGCLLPILRRTFTDDEIDFMCITTTNNEFTNYELRRDPHRGSATAKEPRIANKCI